MSEKKIKLSDAYSLKTPEDAIKLYKKGWKGINIDLNPLAIDLFNFARPSDINICAAISNKETKKKLYFFR